MALAADTTRLAALALGLAAGGLVLASSVAGRTPRGGVTPVAGEESSAPAVPVSVVLVGAATGGGACGPARVAPEEVNSPGASTAPRRDPLLARAGSSARLLGRLSRPAVVRVAGGPEGVLEIVADADGRYASPRLAPGVRRIVVEHGGRFLERELWLRPGHDTMLELDTGTSALLTGAVHDAAGAPIAGARVTLDGVATTSDALGRFTVLATGSGRGFATVSKEGWAPVRVELPSPGASAEPAALSVTLEPACRLDVEVEVEVEVEGEGEGEGELRLILVPSAPWRPVRGPGRASHPWSSAIRSTVAPGAVVLDDLPAAEVTVLALGARGRTASRPVRLDPRHPVRIRLRLEPLPRLLGKVHGADGPVAGAQVRLVPADPVRSCALALGEHVWLLREVVLEALAPPADTAVTTADGAFSIAHPDAGRTGSHLVVTTTDGARRVLPVEPWTDGVRIDLRAGGR